MRENKTINNETALLRFEDGKFIFSATMNEDAKINEYYFTINLINDQIEYQYIPSHLYDEDEVYHIRIYAEKPSDQDTFTLDFEVDFEVKYKEVILKLSDEIQQLKLSISDDRLAELLLKSIEKWFSLNHYRFTNRLCTSFCNASLSTNFPNDLQCLENIKNTLLYESGVTESDSVSVQVLKIIRHITMVDLWKEYEKSALSLDNNDLIVNMFGKYEPNIVFVLKNEYKSYLYDFEDMPSDIRHEINIKWDGTAYIMYGIYWISKKGSKCFTPTDKAVATHILINNHWGGCFEHSRGREFDLASSLSEYSRFASSNGGGTGYCYYIMKKGTKNVITIDDI